MTRFIFLFLLFLSFIPSVSSTLIADNDHKNSFKTEPTVIVSSDGYKLSGVWTLPDHKIKAAVLIIQGSGNVKADGDVSSLFLGTGYNNQKTNLSEQIAEALATKDIATLRFSKRGSEDVKQIENQKFPYLTNDAIAALKLLKSKFSSIKSGIVGFSEGALIASLIARTEKVDALFLMAPITRPIDDVFTYQFKEWPVNLLAHQLDPEKTGNIKANLYSKYNDSDLPFFTVFKTLQIPMEFTWKTIDTNNDQIISIKDELVPFYGKVHSVILGLLALPQFAGWYESLKKLPLYKEIAPELKTNRIFIYQSAKDSQINPEWILEDRSLFKAKTITRKFYSNFGHCFSPMIGALHEIKTSGPLASKFLKDLKKDVAKSLN